MVGVRHPYRYEGGFYKGKDTGTIGTDLKKNGFLCPSNFTKVVFLQMKFLKSFKSWPYPLFICWPRPFQLES